MRHRYRCLLTISVEILEGLFVCHISDFLRDGSGVVLGLLECKRFGGGR